MDWQTASAQFIQRRWREMSVQEMDNWDFKGASWHWGLGHLWSYRGRIWKKYEGSYPEPEAVGLEPEHPFFDPDHVAVGETRDASGRVLDVTVLWRGRRIKPGHRFYPKHL